LAACKLACAGSMAEDAFLNNVEILDVLVKDFMTAEAGLLQRAFQADREAGESPTTPSNQANTVTQAYADNPTIVKAIQYIELHLCDPKLSVGLVACDLELHRDYLGHRFAELVGQRMSRFITNRRVELAKDLLATTDWQIKRIAHHTGHANPNWFSCVFHEATGVAPAEYRVQARRSSPAA
jgi:AraC-like DNA-binding protein